MHDPLRRPRRARGEGQVDDRVGIALGRRGRSRPGRKIVGNGIDPAQEIELFDRGEDVGRLGVGAIAGLGEERGGAGAAEEGDDLGDRIVLVQ